MKWLAFSIVVPTLLFSSATAATLTRGPYLQDGTPSSVVIRWKTDSGTDTLVQYGDAPGNLTGSVYTPALNTEHEITISGLAANGLYYYSIGSSSQTLAGN